MDDPAAPAPGSTNVAETRPGDATGAEETQRVLATAEDGAAETSPNPRTGDEGFEGFVERFGSGVELDGPDDPLPTNHRLRAEALAERGDATDPRGVIPDELIADAAARLAAYDRAYPPLTGTVAELERVAAREGVTIPEGAKKDDIIAAISAARPAR